MTQYDVPKNFDKNLKKRLANTWKLSIHDIKSLFCCCEKVFIRMNT